MDGDIHFCEVFYNDVRIPLGNVVGNVQRRLERRDGDARDRAKRRHRSASASRSRAVVEQLIALARTSTDFTGRPVIETSDIAARLALARAKPRLGAR